MEHVIAFWQVCPWWLYFSISIYLALFKCWLWVKHVIFHIRRDLWNLLRTESWDGKQKERHLNAEAERKTFDELKSFYRQALISNYHDLVQLGNILKKDPIHKQIVATAKRLRSEEDYDLAESYAWALKKRKSSWREYLIIMKCQNCQEQKNYRELPMQSKWKQNKTRIYMQNSQIKLKYDVSLIINT